MQRTALYLVVVMVCTSFVVLGGATARAGDQPQDASWADPILRGVVTEEAGFVDISCELFLAPGWMEHGYIDLTTYRLYADFSGAEGDGVLSGYGITDVPMTWDASDDVFVNAPTGFDSLTAPDDLTGIGVWVNQWDTYVTVGMDTASGDATLVSPDFDTETNDLAADFTTLNGGWFVTPDDVQSQEVDGRVLLAQITMNCQSSADLLVNLMVLDGSRVEGLLETCDAGIFEDCNENCVSDALEIQAGAAKDCDEDGVPDDCQGGCVAADTDCSGAVDTADLINLLATWGPCDTGCFADFDRSTIVDTADLIFLLANWGPCL